MHALTLTCFTYRSWRCDFIIRTWENTEAVCFVFVFFLRVVLHPSAVIPTFIHHRNSPRESLRYHTHFSLHCSLICCLFSSSPLGFSHSPCQCVWLIVRMNGWRQTAGVSSCSLVSRGTKGKLVQRSDFSRCIYSGFKMNIWNRFKNL